MTAGYFVGLGCLNALHNHINLTWGNLYDAW